MGCSVVPAIQAFQALMVSAARSTWLMRSRRARMSPRSRSFAYDTTYNELLSSTDYAGNTTTYTLNANGTVAKVTLPAPSSGAATPIYSFDYDSFSKPTSVTKPDGTVTSSTYDRRWAHRRGDRRVHHRQLRLRPGRAARLQDRERHHHHLHPERGGAGGARALGRADPALLPAQRGGHGTCGGGGRGGEPDLQRHGPHRLGDRHQLDGPDHRHVWLHAVRGVDRRAVGHGVRLRRLPLGRRDRGLPHPDPVV